jgi:hypothetical protein
MIETLEAGIAFAPKALKDGRKFLLIFRMDGQIQIAV